MLRWLPGRLVRAYKAWAEARSYARSTRIRPIAEETLAKPSGSERLHRLNIVQDARCEHRPSPRKLFRNPQAPRDSTSWCDRPNAWTGRRKPRCERCERASQAYRSAYEGDWKSECWLYREARLSAVRLAIERNQYREERRLFLAVRREERARLGPGPTPGNFLELQLL